MVNFRRAAGAKKAPLGPRHRTSVAQSVTVTDSEFLVKHSFRGPPFTIRFVPKESIEALKVRLCEVLTSGEHPSVRAPKLMSDHQITLVHNSRALVDSYTVHDYDLIGGMTINMEYTKPMWVFSLLALATCCMKSLCAAFLVTAAYYWSNPWVVGGCLVELIFLEKNIRRRQLTLQGLTMIAVSKIVSRCFSRTHDQETQCVRLFFFAWSLHCTAYAFYSTRPARSCTIPLSCVSANFMLGIDRH